MKKSIESRLIEGWTEDSPMFTGNVPPVQSYADPVYGRDDSQRYDPSLEKGFAKIAGALAIANPYYSLEGWKKVLTEMGPPTKPGEYAADKIARVAFPAIKLLAVVVAAG